MRKDEKVRFAMLDDKKVDREVKLLLILEMLDAGEISLQKVNHSIKKSK